MDFSSTMYRVLRERSLIAGTGKGVSKWKAEASKILLQQKGRGDKSLSHAAREPQKVSG